MKNALPKILFVFLLSMQSLFAYPPNYDYYNYNNTSTFEIKVTGNSMITVSIDGDYFQNPTKRFSINNMPPGNHYVEIFTEKLQHNGYYSNMKRVKIYAGNVYIKPASLVHAVVDNHGRFYIKNVHQLTTYTEPYYQPYQQPVYPHPPYIHSPMAMHEADFAQLLRVVGDQWFDDTRLIVATQAIQSNWFSSAQIARVMSKMTFEDTKLELAKNAYPKVIDKSNYYIVNSEFWFSSSVEELSRYVMSFR